MASSVGQPVPNLKLIRLRLAPREIISHKMIYVSESGTTHDTER